MKAFHKASSIIPFFPLPPVGKGWKYYPRFLHSLSEELEALLCLGTCPKPWSAHLTKQPGLEQLWNVPQLLLPPNFLAHSSQEETGTGVTRKAHSAHPVWHVQALNWECAEGLWCPGPVSAGLKKGTETGTGSEGSLLSAPPHAGEGREWIKRHLPALGKPASKLIHWCVKPKSLWGSSSSPFIFFSFSPPPATLPFFWGCCHGNCIWFPFSVFQSCPCSESEAALKRHWSLMQRTIPAGAWLPCNLGPPNHHLPHREGPILLFLGQD